MQTRPRLPRWKETDHVHVICTPSGGAKSVRVQSPEAWEQQLSDEELLQLILTSLKQYR